MDKLYWIACDDRDTTLFEGRYQGRTRGAALKFLKEQTGRKSLCGLVFTITEIPVPLIREIVAEILNSMPPATQPPMLPPVELSPAVPTAEPEPETKSSRKEKKINLGHGEAFWSEVRAFYESCRSPKQTAEKFGVSFNSVKTRANREGWRK